MDYAKAGVNIDERDRALKGLIGELNKTMKNRKVLLDIGQYANLIDLGDVALALCTDGVGTKIMVAEQLDDYSSIGIDCIAMNVNDAICVGAEPIAMVDYIAMDKPDERILREIGAGLREGADEAGIAIIGGETAIVPELVRGLDLSGTCLGAVQKDRIVDGSKIDESDALIGLQSSGIHSNGLTLARKVLRPDEATARELLIPTRIYVKPVLELLKRVRVKGLAHMTGSGIRNLKRLKKGIGFEIDHWPEIPEIFTRIESTGVSRAEMFRTFNMGIGFCVVAAQGDVEDTMRILKDFNPMVIGKAVRSAENTIRVGGLSF
jgi:phosphoribosylformylglycinamidine cyclo-ligase